MLATLIYPTTKLNSIFNQLMFIKMPSCREWWSQFVYISTEFLMSLSFFLFPSASVVRSQPHFVIKSHGNALCLPSLPLIRWILALASADSEERTISRPECFPESKRNWEGEGWVGEWATVEDAESRVRPGRRLSMSKRRAGVSSESGLLHRGLTHSAPSLFCLFQASCLDSHFISFMTYQPGQVHASVPCPASTVGLIFGSVVGGTQSPPSDLALNLDREIGSNVAIMECV